MNLRAITFFSFLLASAVSTRAQDTNAPSDSSAFPLSTYAEVGSIFGENRKLSQLGWTEEQFQAFVAGLTESFRGRPRPNSPDAQALVEEIARRMKARARQEAQTRQQYFKNPTNLDNFMKEVCKANQLERLDSGLGFAFIKTAEGGARPEPEDTVVISVMAQSFDGQTKIPALSLDKQSVKVADLVPGLAEAIQLMNQGSGAMVVVPPELSYGEGTWPEGVEPGTPIIFAVALLKITPGS